MSDIRRVLVVGGGVGGLTAAASFARRGAEVLLIERRPAFDVPGVGLGQPANALRVYDALGLLPDILASGFAYDRMYIFDHNRQLIVEHKFLLGDAKVPAFCALSRLRLHEILLAAAERAGVAVCTGVTVSEIRDEKDRATVTFSDGRTNAFDLVAGFDGIRSATRQHLFGTAFVPRPSGYGGWRVQVPRRDYVRGMEFLQGIGSKTGAMPLADDVMYIFHIRPEAPDAVFRREDYPSLLKERLAQYGGYVGEVAASLDANSDIVYSPIEPILVPWPWFRGRVVIGGDAAHTSPPHLTQGAAMAAEDGYVLAREVLDGDGPLEARLLRYSQARYARSAFVYSFSYQWMLDEQSVRTPTDLEAARKELALNASTRIGAATVSSTPESSSIAVIARSGGMKQSGFGRQHQIASLRLQGQASAADAGDAPASCLLLTQSGHWRGIVKQGGKNEAAQTVLVMRRRTELAASADTPRDALAPMTPSRGIETAADDTCPIAITWVVVTSAIAITTPP